MKREAEGRRGRSEGVFRPLSFAEAYIRHCIEPTRTRTGTHIQTDTRAWPGPQQHTQ